MTRSLLPALVLLLSPAAGALAAPQTTGNGFPPRLAARIAAEPPRAGWRIDRSASPTFLAGDFDGRGAPEYAVQIVAKDGHADVLYYLAGDRTRRITRDLGHDWPGMAWSLFPKGERIPGRSDLNASHPGRLAVDGIQLARPSSSAALIYWRNGRFHIHWLSD